MLVTEVETYGHPRCDLCLGASGHEPIQGDGPVMRCYSCLLRIGRMVVAPLEADPDELVDIAIEHADVVELRPCAEHKGGCWAWIGA